MKETIFAISMYIGIGGGWLYNIVWFIDNWEQLGVLAKMVNIFGVFAFPIGSFLGWMHLFFN